MRRLALYLIAAAVLGCPAPAGAAPFTAELERDFGAAAEWWGRAPTGCSTLTLELVAEGSLDAEARATQPIAGEPPVPCVMQVEPPLPLARPCHTLEVVIHEYGHLLGEGHTDDPASIMYGGDPMPGIVCDPIERARLRRQVAETRARCRSKTAPAQRRWCRTQIRSLQRQMHALR